MENVLFLGSLLTGRVVQPSSAVDETIEVVGSNPAGGMGEKKCHHDGTNLEIRCQCTGEWDGENIRFK